MNRGDRLGLGLGAAPLSFLAAFFLLPLGVVVAFGVAAGAGWDVVAALWDRDYYRTRILFTFTQAFGSTVLTLVLGLPLAFLFALHRFPLRRVLRALFTAPFVLPAIVVAVALQAAFGATSWLGQAWDLDVLAMLGPFGAILLAHVYYNVSLVVRIVGAAIQDFPPDLAEAARTLGASRWQTLLRVHAPLALPAILATAALVFLFSATSFGIILLLGGEAVGTIETLIWESTRSLVAHHDRAAILGLVQLATTFVAVALYLFFHRRTSTSLRRVLDQGRRPLPWWGWGLLGAATLFMVGPAAGLTLAAFTHGGRLGLGAFYLVGDDAYRLGSYSAWDAVANSLSFAVATAALALMLAVLALLAMRRLGRARGGAELLAMVPLGASPVLVGLGMILAYDGEPFPDLRASPLRILAAHVLVAFPFVTRILAPAFDAVEPSLREAARTLGATSLQALVRVDLPAVRPALRVAAVFAFAASLGEFGATLLLRRPEFATIPVAIFDALARPGPAFRDQAEVLALVLFVVAAASFWLLELRGRRVPGGWM